MMLHYYAINAPYAEHDPAHAKSIAVENQRAQLISFELLETATAAPSGYRVTERGAVYVEALCDMPLPVKKWVVEKAA
jgi:hypothetical protein